MSTLVANEAEAVRATAVQFTDDWLVLTLSDGRELRVPFRQISWLRWLAHATPEQRADWSLEPGGFAVYWNRLDDGFEVRHLLALSALA